MRRTSHAERPGYADVSERPLQTYLRYSLENARLIAGHVLIRSAGIDAHPERYCETQNRADRIVDEIMREVRG